MFATQDLNMPQLSMPELAGADAQATAQEPAGSAPKPKPRPPKIAKFDHRAKHFFTFTVPDGTERQLTGTVFSEHANGNEATVSVHWPIAALTVLSSKIVEGSTVPLKVRIEIAPGFGVDAKYRTAHAVREGKEPMCTLHLRWPTASIVQAPEPARKRKAEPADSEPERKALKEGLPESVVFALFFTLDDLLTRAPSVEEIGAFMRKLTGNFAHLTAETPPGSRVPVLIDAPTAEYLNREFERDAPAASKALGDFYLITGPFSPKNALDLVEVKNFLKGILCPKSESFCVVLAYDNATVINEAYPNMAFGDNKRALECAARAQSVSPDREHSPDGSESESGVICISDDSDSEDE